MRIIALLIAILTISPLMSVFAGNYTITSQSPYKITSTMNIYAGDTIFLDPSRTREICFEKLNGMEGRPIVIINKKGISHLNGGTLNIRISRSHYLKITGTGDKNYKYGIRLSDSKVMAISIEQFSDNIEVDHVEITGAGFTGISAKTDNYQDIAHNEDEMKFILKNIHFHHNHIHHLRDGEGFYVGHNSWPVDQFGKPQHTLEGVNIHDNILEYTPREAIQVGACTKGTNRIHHNVIRNYGKIYVDSSNIKDQKNSEQNNGIQLGQGFIGDCYNNWIENGPGKGIQLVGIYGANIYNNIIIKSKEWAFYIGNGHNQIRNVSAINIIHNTIICPGKEAIKFDPQKDSIIGNFYNNLIYNAKAIKDPTANSGRFTSDKELKEFNILENDSNKIKFISLKNNNYQLQKGSVAILKAFNTENAPVNFKSVFDYSCKEEDIKVHTDKRKDIGAYEFSMLR